MKTRIALGVSILTIGAMLSGCINRPTHPSQISGVYTSSLKYENYTVQQLTVELNSLSRREAQLVTAQEQRRKTSDALSFYWGYGQGDSVEASELAVVRGELEAVKKALETKGAKP